MQNEVPGAALMRQANELFAAGNLSAASKVYRHLLGQFPGRPFLLNRLAEIALRQGRFGACVGWFKRSVQLDPRQPLSWMWMGIAYGNCNQHGAALAACSRAIELAPDLAQAHDARGSCLMKLGRPTEALASFERALAIDPGASRAHLSRGLVLLQQNRSEEAIACFRRAIDIDPRLATAHRALAVTLRDSHRIEESLASFDAAIAADSTSSVSHCGKAETLLLAGDYERGWEMFGWRWKGKLREKYLDNPLFRDCPVWAGQPLTEKTVVIRQEVGFGDFIMFARYAKLVQQRGAKVVVYTPQALTSLFSSLGPGVQVVQEGDPLPAIDLQIPIMDLPKRFGTTLHTIPSDIPYLVCSPENDASWRGRLGPAMRPRVGLTWSGDGDRSIDRSALRRRSMNFELLRPMLDLPLEFHAVQKQIPPHEEGAMTSAGIRRHELGDFADTAGLVQQMDLVISIDTSVAHLAGALGKPLWVMLPYASDYRWALGAQTPWYPHARLFRQSAPADWSGVIRQVAMHLEGAFNLERSHKAL